MLTDSQEETLRMLVMPAIEAIRDAPLPHGVIALCLERCVAFSAEYEAMFANYSQERFLGQLDRLYVLEHERLDVIQAMLTVRNMCFNEYVRPGAAQGSVQTKMHAFCFRHFAPPPAAEDIGAKVREWVQAEVARVEAQSPAALIRQQKETYAAQEQIRPDTTWRRDLRLPRSQLPREIRVLLNRGMLESAAAVQLTDLQWEVFADFQISRLRLEEVLTVEAMLALTAAQAENLRELRVVNAVLQRPDRLAQALQLTQAERERVIAGDASVWAAGPPPIDPLADDPIDAALQTHDDTLSPSTP